MTEPRYAVTENGQSQPDPKERQYVCPPPDIFEAVASTKQTKSCTHDARASRKQNRPNDLLQARLLARSAAIRAGMSASDADDIASCFLLSYLRRLAEVETAEDTTAEQNADPRYLLPLFLRCQVSRVRFRARRETTSLNADTDFSGEPCSPAQTQTEQIVERCAFWEEIAEAMSYLPALQRAVLVGYVINDETLASITAKHNITESAASKALSRARSALRKSLRQ